MENLSEGLLDFKTLEKTIFRTMCQVACQLIRQYLQVCDRVIMARRDAKEYRCIGRRATTIKTLMGEVAYERYYYKKRSGGYVFLLDEAMGIHGGSGLVSENLAEQIVIECTDKSFRKAAGSISSLTGQAVSAMGAWGVLKRFGEKLEGQEARLEELDSKGITGQLGGIKCPVLFSEMDDVCISTQKEKRAKKGNPPEGGRKKSGNRLLHIGTAYTGWAEKKDGSHRTLDKIAYASLGDAAGFTSTFEALLRQRFDMDGISSRVMNGDGASWVKVAAEDSDSILQLDPYHRSRAITRAVSGSEDRKALYEAFKEKNTAKALGHIYELIGKEQEDGARNRLGELFEYFHSNRDNLLTWSERDIELPAPPAGVSYRGLGVQESSNTMLTQRMKHRKGSWSINGANHMAKILCFRHTIGLDAILGVFPEPPAAGDQTPPLSAAKAPLYDGKGYDGGWLHAEMPFEQAFLTSGRKAIMGLLRQRPISDLSFI